MLKWQLQPELPGPLAPPWLGGLPPAGMAEHCSVPATDILRKPYKPTLTFLSSLP